MAGRLWYLPVSELHASLFLLLAPLLLLGVMFAHCHILQSTSQMTRSHTLLIFQFLPFHRTHQSCFTERRSRILRESKSFLIIQRTLRALDTRGGHSAVELRWPPSVHLIRMFFT